MNEFVDDLEGVEVIADDFLIAEFGNSDRQVNNSLKRHECAFLKKCRLWNLKLNCVKVKQHHSSVKFMGQLLTSQGLRGPRPYSRCLNLRMSLHWGDSLGWWPIFQSDSEPSPHLSEMTEPLRSLENKNVEFQWLPQHFLAMNTIKKFLTGTPVLCYYDVSKPITYPMLCKPVWLRGCIAYR